MSAPAVSGDGMSFKIIHPALEHGLAARVGRLVTANRTPLDTPTFVGVTSRGAVPHLTPDVISKHTDIRAAYMALEDCRYLMLPPSLFLSLVLTCQS